MTIEPALHLPVPTLTSLLPGPAVLLPALQHLFRLLAGEQQVSQDTQCPLSELELKVSMSMLFSPA